MATSTQWRIYVVDSNGGGYVEIAEIDFGVALGGGSYIESSHYSTLNGAGAFDGSSSTRWIDGNGTGNEWVGWTFTSAVSVVNYSIQASSDATRAPKNFHLDYYNSGTSSWVTLATPATQTGWTAGEIRTFSTLIKLSSKVTGQFNLDAYKKFSSKVNSKFALNAYNKFSSKLGAQFAIADGTYLRFSSNINSQFALNSFIPQTGYLTGQFALGAFQKQTSYLTGQLNLNAYVYNRSIINSQFIFPVYTKQYGQISGQLALNAFTKLNGKLNADYYFDATELFKTLVANLHTNAHSTYSNFEFNSLSGQYGAKDDGIYELTGTTDNGVNIDCLLDVGKTDFQSPFLKRMTTAYLGLRSDGIVKLTVSTENGTNSYSITTTADKIMTNKINLGLGGMGRYWQFILENQNGSSLSVDGIEVLVDILSRRAGGSAKV